MTARQHTAFAIRPGEPRDVAERGQDVERVAANRLDEPAER